MNLSDVSLISIVITSGVATFLLIYTAKRTASYVFVLLICCFSVFSLAELVMRGAGSADQGLFWGSVGYAVAIFTGSALVHFSLVFPHRFFLEGHQRLRNGLVFFFYGCSFVLIGVFYSGISLASVELQPWGYRLGVTSETLFAIFWVVVCAVCAIAVFVFGYFRRMYTVRERKQIRVLLFGTGILLFSKVAVNFLPLSFHEFMLPLTTASFAIFAGLVTFALFRYRLFMPAPTETAEAVVDTMADALLVVDGHETIVQVNAAASSVLDYPEKELVGRRLSSILEFKEKTECVLNLPVFSRLGSSGRIKDVELTFITKDGVHVQMNVSGSQIVDKNGVIQGTVLVARDLSKTKILIDELAMAKGLLELKVEARTRELYQANLELQSEIATRKGAQDHLEKSLQEKELLLKEIHHRVKNNLQVISSILDLQAGTIADERTMNVFKESQSRIRSMALIHEQLYQSDDFAWIDFEQYLQSLSVNLFHSLRISTNDIQLEIEATNILLSVDDSISCGFIVNELIINSFKYGFPDGRKGKIIIIFKKTNDGFFQLVVRDDGIGFPEDIDFRNTKTLGLQLVNILVNQLKGTITLSRENGTMFTLRFPAKTVLR